MTKLTKQDFFHQPGRRFFFDDPSAVADYVRAFYPEEAAQVIATADDIADQRFLFNMHWDLERTHIPVCFDGDIDWLHQPEDDPEWVYAFNRMRFWLTLGQAYALTRKEKYAVAFVSQLTHWITTVRRDDPAYAAAWRSIEVGLRLENWLKAARCFEGSPSLTDEVMSLFAQSVAEHAAFLMEVWDSYHLMSNWGVLENHGLFLAGVMMPQDGATRAWTSEALRRLGLEARMQVYRDGTHWEQSSLYHNEVLRCFLNVALLARRNGIPLPEGFAACTQGMCLYSLYAAKPDCHALCMGDSDDIDWRRLLTMGALLFDDGRLVFGGGSGAGSGGGSGGGAAAGNPCFDTAWDIGESGLDACRSRAATIPEETDRAFFDSGNFYLRSGWGASDTYLHFHAGPLGAGHGHADQLHFDLFSRGEDILVDAGRHSYVFGPGRVEFKEMEAHNTVMIDGVGLYVCRDSWACAPLSRALGQHFFSDGRYGYAEGGHLGYMTLPSGGVYSNRRLIWLKPDLLIVADEFYGLGSHAYRQFFHFDALGSLASDGPGFIYRGKNAAATVRLANPDRQTKIIDTKMSRHYNTWEPNQTLQADFTAQGFVCAYTVFALSDIGQGTAFSVEKQPVRSGITGAAFADSQVEALDIRLGDNRYTLVVAHEEFASPTDVFLADGCTGFGSAVVFDRTAGETEIGTVLRW
ncbi:MAG: heparinase II/III family protein [Oscillospiraceae bacterium]|nr:heparinase II/III family protein [Oscillospiraceae bacterium]